MKNKNSPSLISNIICTTLVLVYFSLAVCELIIYYGTVNKLWFIINITTVSLSLAGYLISKFILKTKAFHKFCSLAIFLYFVIFLFFTIAKRYHFLDNFSDVQKIKQLILSTGNAGVITFIVIQCLQVLISPIPGIALVIVGAQIYGSFLGFVYSSIGILIGSIIAFFIGRLCGKSLAVWLVGEENTKKWRKTLEKKGKFLLPFMFILPLFPDDIICIVAGMTTMNFLYFLIVALISRPIGILAGSYLCGGKLIPYRWPYTLIWIAIIIAIIIGFSLLLKYQEKIEKFFISKFSNRKKPNKKTDN